ncbi:hypothetical protein N7507_002005 [Penicillium longicatenatum]|nr:hypothetical protein N7507_002005 [Penicillium longicatenatum]
MSSDSNAPSELSNLPERCIHSPSEKRLWCHFVNVTCHVLTLPFDGGYDPIMSGIISKALHDTMVLNAILCLGASHLINQFQAGSSEVKGLMGSKKSLLGGAQQELATRVLALRSPKGTTADESAEYEALLTAYLLLYLYEISEGTGDHSWKARLDDARSFVYGVLQKHRSPSESGSRPESENDEIQTLSCEDFECLGIDIFLMQFFSYHDILGSVTNNHKSSNRSQRMDGLISLQALQTDYFDHEYMLGLHHGLLEITSRVHTLQLDTSDSTVPRHEIITRAVNIWQDVSEWTVPEFDSDLRHMYEAYIAAISIWVLSIIHPGDVAKDKVQTMVARGLISLSLLEGFELQTVSLLPFFVIGLGCIHQQDREAFERQLWRLEIARCLGYIRICRGKIRKAWQDYDGGNNRSWDWNCISQADGLSLPLA